MKILTILSILLISTAVTAGCLDSCDSAFNKCSAKVGFDPEMMTVCEDAQNSCYNRCNENTCDENLDSCLFYCNNTQKDEALVVCHEACMLVHEKCTEK